MIAVTAANALKEDDLVAAASEDLMVAESGIAGGGKGVAVLAKGGFKKGGSKIFFFID